MTDLEDRLNAYFARDRHSELPPDSFDRLTARLHRPVRRRARPLVALVTAAVLAVSIATLVAIHSDDDQTVRSTNDPATGGTRPPAESAGPETYAAVVDPDGDGLGDVVIMSARSGSVLETVYRRTPVSPDAGEVGATSVDVAPDGTIYYEVCCAPATGQIRGFDPNNGTDLGLIAKGTSPAVSPDGRRLAVAAPPDAPGRISMIDLETGQPEEKTWPVGGTPSSEVVTALAWSQDNRTIAVEHLSYTGGTFAGVVVDLLDTRTGTWRPVDTGTKGVAMPAFRADGTLLVTSPAHETDDGGPIAGDRIVLWDPATRRVDASIQMDRVADLDASPDGKWVIASRYGALPHRIANPQGIGDLGELKGAPSAVIAAAW